MLDISPFVSPSQVIGISTKYCPCSFQFCPTSTPPLSFSENAPLNDSSSNTLLHRYCQPRLLRVPSHNASTKSRRCDFPELLRPIMTLIGLIVSKPAHSFLKQRCPLKYMESIFTMNFPSACHDVEGEKWAGSCFHSLIQVH